MEKMKTPLTILTCAMTISFLDGFFGWGVGDDVYAVLGFAMIGSIGWLWYIVTR